MAGKRGGAGNGAAKPKARPEAEDRRRSPKDAGERKPKGRGRTKPRPHKRKRMRGGISRNPQGRREGLVREPGSSAEPARVAGIAPRLEAAGRRRRPRPEPRPEKGASRGFGPKALPEGGKDFGSSVFRRATGEASASMRALGDGSGFGPARIRPGKRRRGFGLAQATRRGSARGSSASPSRDPNGTEQGFAALLRDRGAPGLAAQAIPKPPSARWPRHPATAVKAGTSGGRWRHRPPLFSGFRICPAPACLSLFLPGGGPLIF